MKASSGPTLSQRLIYNLRKKMGMVPFTEQLDYAIADYPHAFNDTRASIEDLVLQGLASNDEATRHKAASKIEWLQATWRSWHSYCDRATVAAYKSADPAVRETAIQATKQLMVRIENHDDSKIEDRTRDPEGDIGLLAGRLHYWIANGEYPEVRALAVPSVLTVAGSRDFSRYSPNMMETALSSKHADVRDEMEDAIGDYLKRNQSVRTLDILAGSNSKVAVDAALPIIVKRTEANLAILAKCTPSPVSSGDPYQNIEGIELALNGFGCWQNEKARSAVVPFIVTALLVADRTYCGVYRKQDFVEGIRTRGVAAEVAMLKQLDADGLISVSDPSLTIEEIKRIRERAAKLAAEKAAVAMPA